MGARKCVLNSGFNQNAFVDSPSMESKLPCEWIFMQCVLKKNALDCGNDHHAGQAGEESNGSNLEILFIGLDIQPRETLWKLQLNLTIIKSISVGYYPHKHMETKVCLECVCFF